MKNIAQKFLVAVLAGAALAGGASAQTTASKPRDGAVPVKNIQVAAERCRSYFEESLAEDTDNRNALISCLGKAKAGVFTRLSACGTFNRVALVNDEMVIVNAGFCREEDGSIGVGTVQSLSV